MLLLALLVALAHAGTLVVDVLDVGQGDSILLTTPAGKTVLIDGGTGRIDPVPLLRRRGVESLDLVIASHPHADHIGGIDQVLEALPVKVYTDNGMPHTTSTYEKVMTLVEEKGVVYRTAEAGQVYNLDDGIRVEILHPQLTLLKNTRSDLNSNSVVARVTHGELCFLFTGDAEDPTERALLAQGIDSCEVLKVAHHGSSHSSSSTWLRAIQPEIALISAGANNRYGHPDEETLARLTSAGASVYRTDQHGSIQLRSDGEQIEVLTNVMPAAAPVPARALSGDPRRMQPGPEREGVHLEDLNSRTAAELEALPGIGPAKAAAIVRWREEHGPFTSLEALQEVPGIGPGTVAMLRGGGPGLLAQGPGLGAAGGGTAEAEEAPPAPALGRPAPGRGAHQ